MVGVFVDIGLAHVDWLLHVDFLVNKDGLGLNFNNLDLIVVGSVTLHNLLNVVWLLCEDDCLLVAMLVRVLDAVFVFMVVIIVDANSLDAFALAGIQCSGSHAHVVVVITTGGLLFPGSNPGVSSGSP